MGISFNAAALLNGNGIDVKSVVTAILTPETAPLTAWQNQQTDLSTQAGLLSGLNNNLTSLAAAVLALANSSGPLASQSATSSDSSILTASAATTAAPGTHQIVVSSSRHRGHSLYQPAEQRDHIILDEPRHHAATSSCKWEARVARLMTSSSLRAAMTLSAPWRITSTPRNGESRPAS